MLPYRRVRVPSGISDLCPDTTERWAAWFIQLFHRGHWYRFLRWHSSGRRRTSRIAAVPTYSVRFAPLSMTALLSRLHCGGTPFCTALYDCLLVYAHLSGLPLLARFGQAIPRAFLGPTHERGRVLAEVHVSPYTATVWRAGTPSFTDAAPVDPEGGQQGDPLLPAPLKRA